MRRPAPATPAADRPAQSVGATQRRDHDHAEDCHRHQRQDPKQAIDDDRGERLAAGGLRAREPVGARGIGADAGRQKAADERADQKDARGLSTPRTGAPLPRSSSIQRRIMTRAIDGDEPEHRGQVPRVDGARRPPRRAACRCGSRDTRGSPPSRTAESPSIRRRASGTLSRFARDEGQRLEEVLPDLEEELHGAGAPRERVDAREVHQQGAAAASASRASPVATPMLRSTSRISKPLSLNSCRTRRSVVTKLCV